MNARPSPELLRKLLHLSLVEMTSRYGTSCVMYGATPLTDPACQRHERAMYRRWAAILRLSRALAKAGARPGDVSGLPASARPIVRAV